MRSAFVPALYGARDGAGVLHHTTLCRFRERLNVTGLSDKLLALVSAQLEVQRLMVKRGTLIDATVVEAAAAMPGADAAGRPRVDADAAFLKRAGKSGLSYGYKAHVAVDAGSLIVRNARLTPANVAETVVADELILATRDGGAVYADKAYDTRERRKLLAQLCIEDHIMHRPNKHHPALAPAQRGPYPRCAARSRPCSQCSSGPTAIAARAILGSCAISCSSRCLQSASTCVEPWS